MRVKICGITNLADAFAACEAGADALGFVFYKHSPRYIDPIKAREIIEKLPPFVQKVGLFVNHTIEELDLIATTSRIDLAQIHFEVSSEFLDATRIKTLPVVRADTREKIADFGDRYRLVDAFVDGYGGEGKRLDLEWFKGVDCSKIILAGGLTINNVDEVKRFDFYGVDVSSGVEKSHGVKDHKKVAEFIKRAKSL